MTKWFDGIPDCAAVTANESDHPRPDGIRLGRISVDGYPDYVWVDDCSYGEWICHHHKSRLQPYISTMRLKVANGEVLFAIGFTQWSPLANMPWASECRYFPVGQSGLPKDYKEAK